MLLHIVTHVLGAEIFHELVRHDVDLTVMAKRRQFADDPKDTDIATGAREGFRNEPAKLQRSRESTADRPVAGSAVKQAPKSPGAGFRELPAHTRPVGDVH